MRSRQPGRPCDRERGSSTVLGVGVILVLVSLLAGFLLVGAAVHGSLRARGAADAAALAGAGVLLEGGDQGAACAVAAELAEANGARMVSCEKAPSSGPRVRAGVRVEVAVPVPGLGDRDAHAVAHAGAVPAPEP